MKRPVFTIFALLSLVLFIASAGLLAGGYGFSSIVFYWQWADNTGPEPVVIERWFFARRGDIGLAHRSTPVSSLANEPARYVLSSPGFRSTLSNYMWDQDGVTLAPINGAVNMRESHGFPVPKGNYTDRTLPAWPPVVLFALLPLWWILRFKQSIAARRLRGENVGVTRRQLILAHTVASFSLFLFIMASEGWPWMVPRAWLYGLLSPLLAPVLLAWECQRGIRSGGSPLWAYIMLIRYFIPLGIAFAIAFRWLPPRRVAGRCINCGYDLRATPDRCPECGVVPV